MRKFLSLFCWWLLPASIAAQVQFPNGYGNRDGSTVVDVIGRQAEYPTYSDKVFYCDPVGNSPSFLFPDYGEANTSIGGCGIGRKYMNWFVEYKIDNMNNVRTFTVSPNAGEITKTLLIVAHNQRRTQCIGGGENNEYITVSSLTLKFETPQFTGLDEVKTVCNSVDHDYNLTDNFTVKDGVTFYLDDPASAPITKLNPKDLTPGFHRLIAQKQYDNGTPDIQFGSKPGIVSIQYDFQVLEGVKITIGAYPRSICQNAQPVVIKATPTGGTWEGRSMDAAGNITPSSMATGRNVYTYKISNAAGCTSAESIEITGNAPPVIKVSDIDVCRGAEAFLITVGEPVGGSYSGRGVLNLRTFDPAQGVVGRNPVRYTYMDPGTTCSSSGDFQINIIDASNFKVGADFTTCNTSAEIDLNQRSGVSPNDGSISWSGTGIINGKYFSPVTAGIGLHTITGTLFIPETGCTYTKNFVIKVVTGPTVKPGTDLSVCGNAAPFQIPGGSPTGGTWTGSYINTNVFSPSNAVAGDYLVTYTYTNSVCAVVVQKIITVQTPPVLSVGPDYSICRNAGPVSLPVATPAGGSWAADGPYYDAATGQLDPLKMAIGRNTLTYTFTDGVCAVSKQLIITVVMPPAVDAGADQRTCVNTDPVTLSGTADGWSGPGVDLGRFSPSRAGVGEHLLTYTVTDPVTLCSASDQMYMKVSAPPEVNAHGDNIVCKAAGDYYLGTGSPIGATWSGAFVQNGYFQASIAPLGNYTLFLTYTDPATGCTGTDIKFIKLVDAPVLNVGPNYSICRNAGPVSLPVATPAGGSWAADGPYYDAATGQLDPLKMAVGTNTLTYTYESVICTVSKQLVITVVMPPIVDAGADQRTCLNADPVTLPGTAAGWSGPGVDLGRFLPARASVGEHLLTYTVADPVTLCSASDQMYMKVSAPPAVDAGADVVICAAAGDYYLQGGKPLGAVWSGSFVQNNYFQAGKAPLGSYTLTLTYTDPVTGCIGTDTRVLQLVAAPVLNVGPDYNICRNAGPVSLPVAIPTGGRWVADGPYYDAATGQLDPLKMLVGTNTLTYTYSDGVCTVSKQLIITVVMPPAVDAGADQRTCLNANPVTLPGTAEGWSGSGVDLGRFLPARAGVGEQLLTYTVTDPVTLCSASDQMYMKVSAPPAVDAGADVVICAAAGDYYLQGGKPLGAVWSGPFVQNSYFQAGKAPLGNYTLTLTFTDPATGCTGTDTRVIKLVAAPVLDVGADIGTCVNNDMFAPPLPSVSGGTWKPLAGNFYDGATGLLDPKKMQLGKNYLIYTIITDAGCSISDTLGITLHALPVVTGMRDFSTCLNGPTISLVATPQPGIWAGDGIDNNAGSFFVPKDAGAGDHTITYKYTDPTTGCTTIDTTLVKVNTLPTITMPNDTAVCVSSGAVTLKAKPGGGSWAGSAGIVGTTFSPAIAGVGTYAISYTVTDLATRCTNTASYNITVRGLPGAINLAGDTAACENTILTLTAAADNTSMFEWYRVGETTPFETATTIKYTVTKDEQLIIKPKPVNTGDCAGSSRIFSIINNSPRGTVKYEGLNDTLAFGTLYRATSMVEKAAIYRWDFGDGGFSTQGEGNHYYYTPGRHAVSLTATGVTGCIVKYPLQDVFIRDENGKVPDPQNDRGDGMDPGSNDLLIYPTTFNQLLTAEFMLKAPQDMVITFFDFRGNTIYETKQAAVKGRNRIRLATEKLHGSGVWYFIRLQCNEFTDTEKIFKL
jgi:hypothetical protein